MPSWKQRKVDTPKASNNKKGNNRNRSNIVTIMYQSENTQPEQVPEQVTVKQARSGRISKPLDRFVEADD